MFDSTQTFNRPLGPFAVLYEPRKPTKLKPEQKTPRTNGTKAQQSAISLESPEERLARRRALKASRTAELVKRALLRRRQELPFSG